MPKDYKNINKKKPSTKNRLGGLLSFTTGLVVGLFVAFVVYLHEHQTGIESLSVSGPDITVTDTKNMQGNNDQTETLNDIKPETKFDFYKILPSIEVNVSEWVADDTSSLKPDSGMQGLYVLQVGSFKEYKSADEIKARLALIGIRADIQRVVINGRDVRHRVRVGPYKDPEKLHEVRKHLLANKLDFMLLKLGKDDV